MENESTYTAYERLYQLQFENLNRDLNELKDRVKSLEVALARGVMLLVANLAGVVIMLAQQIIHR
ncbi:MAG: hypothetical protein HZB26_13755 [Candidatus Hydrogenedentes bacterium]|nr:hypothetical protein [Candidatus Hydrogenedentota bacterium]